MMIGLSELDKEVSDMMVTFYSHLEDKFGSNLKAWIHGIDKKKTTRVPKADFVQRLKDMGLEGVSGARIFQELLLEPGKPFLTLTDLDPKAEASLARGDYEYGIDDIPKDHKSPLLMTFNERNEAHPITQRKILLARHTRAVIEAYNAEKYEKNMGARTVKDFKQLIENRFGSTHCVYD